MGWDGLWYLMGSQSSGNTALILLDGVEILDPIEVEIVDPIEVEVLDAVEVSVPENLEVEVC